jgi:hypothetical protein
MEPRQLLLKLTSGGEVEPRDGVTGRMARASATDRREDKWRDGAPGRMA